MSHFSTSILSRSFIGISLLNAALIAQAASTPGIRHITSLNDCQHNLHEFVRDPISKEVFHRENGKFWHPLGGAFTSEPKPLIGMDCVVRVFGRGTDNSVYMRTLSTNWAGWGGVLLSAPEPFLHNGTIAVSGIGTDKKIWYRTIRSGWTNANNNQPAPVDFPGIDLDEDLSDDEDFILVDPAPFPSPGIPLGHGPTPGIDGISVVSTCEGELHMFRRDPFTATLLHRDLSSRFWRNLGGTLTSEPKAVVDKSCKLHVFARGSGSGLYRRGLKDGWGGFGGVILSAPYLSISDNGILKIKAFGTDKKLWERTLSIGWRPIDR